MKSRISRFAEAAGLAGALLLAAGAAAQAQAVYGGVRIDMSAIPNGAFQTKQQLQACLQRALPQALGARVSPGARGAPSSWSGR